MNEEILEEVQTKQPIITQKEVKYINPRTSNIDLFVELDVYHDDEFVYPTGVVKGCQYTDEIYQRAIAGEFGEVQIIELPEPNKKLLARQVRDAFLTATDKLTIVDYTIKNERLTEEQREVLFAVRDDFKKWTEQEGWPEIDLPDMPLWLMNEAVNHGWQPPRDYTPSELLEYQP